MVGVPLEETNPVLTNKVNIELTQGLPLRCSFPIQVPIIRAMDKSADYSYDRRMRTIQTYAEFWPYYLGEHDQAATRGWHYVGTALAIGLLVYALASQTWVLLPLVLVSGYFFAWVSHGLIEKNKPATFTYPLWSLISDFKMLFHFLTGTMGRELEKARARQNAVS